VDKKLLTMELWKTFRDKIWISRLFFVSLKGGWEERQIGEMTNAQGFALIMRYVQQKIFENNWDFIWISQELFVC
jgi:hypothetical protein